MMAFGYALCSTTFLRRLLAATGIVWFASRRREKQERCKALLGFAEFLNLPSQYFKTWKLWLA
jgi:hypothetical protein